MGHSKLDGGSDGQSKTIDASTSANGADYQVGARAKSESVVAEEEQALKAAGFKSTDDLLNELYGGTEKNGVATFSGESGGLGNKSEITFNTKTGVVSATDIQDVTGPNATYDMNFGYKSMQGSSESREYTGKPTHVEQLENGPFENRPHEVSASQLKNVEQDVGHIADEYAASVPSLINDTKVAANPKNVVEAANLAKAAFVNNPDLKNVGELVKGLDHDNQQTIQGIVDLASGLSTEPKFNLQLQGDTLSWDSNMGASTNGSYTQYDVNLNGTYSSKVIQDQAQTSQSPVSGRFPWAAFNGAVPPVQQSLPLPSGE